MNRIFQLILGCTLLIGIALSACEQSDSNTADTDQMLQLLAQSNSQKDGDSLVQHFIDRIDSSDLSPYEKAAQLDTLASICLEKQRYRQWETLSYQALYHYKKSTEASRMLMEMANVMDSKLKRKPISKGFYRAVVDYFEGSDAFDRAKANIAEDQPPLREQIQDLEDMLMVQIRTDSLSINKRAGVDYITGVRLLAAVNPGNDDVPLLLNRAATLSKGLKQYDLALQLYDWLLEKYDDHEEVAKGLFYKGFTLDEEVNNDEQAELVYGEFLERFPEHDLAPQVKILKSQVHLSEEELAKRLKEGMKDSTETRD